MVPVHIASSLDASHLIAVKILIIIIIKCNKIINIIIIIKTLVL